MLQYSFCQPLVLLGLSESVLDIDPDKNKMWDFFQPMSGTNALPMYYNGKLHINQIFMTIDR